MDQKSIDKLNQMADNLQKDIDDAFRKRDMNTYRKFEQAKHAVNKGLHALIVQTMMRAIANWLQEGKELPEVIRERKTKDGLMEIASMSVMLPSIREAYTQIGIDWEAIQIPKHVKQFMFEAEVALKKIPSYFPTPRPVVEKMLSYLHLSEETTINILEPSAGMGHIADVLKEHYPAANIDCVEINYSLVDILKAKEYNTQRQDFVEFIPEKSYQAVVMNPPFEKKQDIEHITKAYDILENGGQLVAIASAGILSNSDKKTVAFREMVDNTGGFIERLDDKSFMQSDRPTGVSTVLVYMSKN